MCVCRDDGLCLFFNDPSIDKMDAMTGSPGKTIALYIPQY